MKFEDFIPPPPPGIPADVCYLYEQLTFELIGKQIDRYSSDAILHRIRWHFHVDRGVREFKCNDNWTPDLARWFIARHPQHRKFFELRVLKRRRKS